VSECLSEEKKERKRDSGFRSFLFTLGARRFAAFVSFSVLIILVMPCPARADVYVYDAVAVQGEEVRLKAETRGAVFIKGGELVEFFVDDASLGKNLSGGDGAAYRFYKTSRPGLKNIRAVSRNMAGTGLLLVLKPAAGIVAVDVEGSLLQEGFLSPGRPESRKALESIAKRFPLIYLQSGQTSLKAVRYWLQQNEYADAPLLPWDGGDFFDALAKKGLKIRAVVGAPGVIESAARHKPEAFSFEPVKGAVRLKSWKEMEGHLK
jgi:hypothetical protein